MNACGPYVLLILLLVVTFVGIYLRLRDTNPPSCQVLQISDACTLNPSCIQQKINSLGTSKSCSFDTNANTVCCSSSDPVNVLSRRSRIACAYYKFQFPPDFLSLSTNTLMDEYKNVVRFKQKEYMQLWGGSNAHELEFPHMVALGFYNERTRFYQFDCGGSLISSRFVLTAAHCIANIDCNQVKVARVGTLRVPAATQTTGSDDVQVKSVRVHPDYCRHLHKNDIALVELVREVEFSRNVHPACLFSTGEEPLSLIATGWGQLGNFVKSEVLQKSVLELVPRAECNEFYTRLHRVTVGFGQICARNESSDACEGDSGGPLQVKNGGVFEIVGIVSFGGICRGRYPGVYTKIYDYLDWIENIVWPQSDA